MLLFFFQFSLFLWTKLGLFLLFPFAFIPFSLITHICFSSVKNDLRQFVRLTLAVRGAQFIVSFAPWTAVTRSHCSLCLTRSNRYAKYGSSKADRYTTLPNPRSVAPAGALSPATRHPCATGPPGKSW